MLMLFTGVFERTWPKPFKGLSTVIGGMIPLWGAWIREWFGVQQTCGRQTLRRVDVGNEGEAPGCRSTREDGRVLQWTWCVR